MRWHAPLSRSASRSFRHSLGVGAAVSLVRSGAQTLEVQQVGRWKDQRMPAHYARHEAAARNTVARYRYGQ